MFPREDDRNYSISPNDTISPRSSPLHHDFLKQRLQQPG